MPQPFAFEHDDAHPLDVLEHIAALNDWAFERINDDEITFMRPARSNTYQVIVSWVEDIDALHVVVPYEFTVPSNKSNDVAELVSAINVKNLIGHFDYWKDDRAVLFRHVHLLNAETDLNQTLSLDLCTYAVDACERFFPAFQYVLWAGYKIEDAIKAALFETEGEA